MLKGGRKGGSVVINLSGKCSCEIITQSFCSVIGRNISSAVVNIIELMHLIVTLRQTGRGVPQKCASRCGSVWLCVYRYLYIYVCVHMNIYVWCMTVKMLCRKGLLQRSAFYCKWKNTRACHAIILVPPTPQSHGSLTYLWVCASVENHLLVRNVSSQCTGREDGAYNAAALPQRFKARS